MDKIKWLKSVNSEAKCLPKVTQTMQQLMLSILSDKLTMRVFFLIVRILYVN